MSVQERAFFVLRLALAHYQRAALRSSAELCLLDAIQLYRERRYLFALCRATKSLSYSVGGFHQDHETACRLGHD